MLGARWEAKVLFKIQSKLAAPADRSTGICSLKADGKYNAGASGRSEFPACAYMRLCSFVCALEPLFVLLGAAIAGI